MEDMNPELKQLVCLKLSYIYVKARYIKLSILPARSNPNIVYLKCYIFLTYVHNKQHRKLYFLIL